MNVYIAAMQLQRICNGNHYQPVYNGHAACMCVSKGKKTVAYLPLSIKLHLSM